MAKKRRRTTQKHLPRGQGDRFHHDDGSHRATAPTTNGRLLEQFERGMRRHLADGHKH